MRFGEVWHYFEKQLNYPVSILDSNYFSRIDLEGYDILILPGGRYGNYFKPTDLKKLKKWVANGGRLIALGGAISAIDGDDGFSIKPKKNEKKNEHDELLPFSDSERERMKSAITGAIFKVKVDNSHPLAYGYPKDYFTLKLGSNNFEYLKNGNAVYFEENTTPVSGFAGIDAQKQLAKTLILGAESYGKGSVIYFIDNPLFRGFWENGKLFFANALFMMY